MSNTKHIKEKYITKKKPGESTFGKQIKLKRNLQAEILKIDSVYRLINTNDITVAELRRLKEHVVSLNYLLERKIKESNSRDS